MTSKEKLTEATLKILCEGDNTELSSTNESEQECSKVCEQLKSIEGDRDTVRKYKKGIEVSFYRGDRIELYGTIDCKNKTTKLAMGSGPNPLTPDFLELLNQLSNVLSGYKHLHY